MQERLLLLFPIAPFFLAGARVLCFHWRVLRRPPTLASHGMVVASHPLAAEAGAAMLRAGGHAVDAAIAAAAVLSVVEPSASGLGGDAFFLIHDRQDGQVAAINGSGAAPHALTPDRFAGLSAVPLRGALSATVPGCVSAWEEARYGWGRLEWHDLLAPAIALASEGAPVSWRMARVLRRQREVLAADPGLSRLYLHPDGSPLAAGEIVRPWALARTLEALADEGSEAFYEGELAERLCRGVQAAGGVLSVDDLAGHESRLLAPYELELHTRAGAAVLCEQPLPSQGILLLLMGGILEEAGGGGPALPWIELHRQLQCARIAFALRDALLTDPEFLPVPEADLVSALLSERTFRGLAQLVDEEPIAPELAGEVVLRVAGRSNPEFEAVLDRYRARGCEPGRAGGAEGTDTTYLCVVDGGGNAVGLIQSIFQPFGCGVLEPDTGILLNDRASGFSLDPRHVNRLTPGKRSMHTLNSYMLLKGGSPWLVGGTPGADQQIQTNLQILRHFLGGRVLWPGPPPMLPGKWTQARRPLLPAAAPEGAPGAEGGADSELLAEALEAPRWSLPYAGDVRMEARFAAETRRRLARLGHRPVRIGPWEGSGLVQAIQVLGSGACLGATDPRGEGMAVGL